MTAFIISNDCANFETNGPYHCGLKVDGFQGNHFASGSLQLVYRGRCLVSNKYVDSKSRLVLKQHRLECCRVEEVANVENLSAEDLDRIELTCDMKSAKVHYFVTLITLPTPQSLHTTELQYNRIVEERFVSFHLEVHITCTESVCKL